MYGIPIEELGMQQREAMELDYSKISNVEIEDIDTRDCPDFCDAYISYAEYDGVPMTEAQLEILNEDADYVYEKVMDYIH